MPSRSPTACDEVYCNLDDIFWFCLRCHFSIIDFQYFNSQMREKNFEIRFDQQSIIGLTIDHGCSFNISSCGCLLHCVIVVVCYTVWLWLCVTLCDCGCVCVWYRVDPLTSSLFLRLLNVLSAWPRHVASPLSAPILQGQETYWVVHSFPVPSDYCKFHTCNIVVYQNVYRTVWAASSI